MLRRAAVAPLEPGLLKLESSEGRSAGREDKDELVAGVTSGIAAWSGAGLWREPRRRRPAGAGCPGLAQRRAARKELVHAPPAAAARTSRGRRWPAA